MRLNELNLRNFRNYEELSLDFEQGVNLIVGNNAQGKTNVLEAIYYAAIGKSFRGQHAPEVIRFDAESAVISLDFTANTMRCAPLSISTYSSVQLAPPVTKFPGPHAPAMAGSW